MNERLSELAPAAIIGAGIGLRLFQIDQAALWYDEAFTYLLSRLDLVHLVQATAGDVHPPLHYLLLWVINHTLNPVNIEAAMRLPSVLASIAAMVMLWVISGQMQLNRSARLIGLLLLAVQPFEIWYSSEARMYALLQLLIMVEVYAVYARRPLLLFASTGLALYTHNYAILYSVAIYLVAMMLELRRPRPVYVYGKGEWQGTQMVQIWAAGAGAVALYLPWVVLALIPQMRFVASGMHWVQPFELGQLWWGLATICLGVSLPVKSLLPFYLMLMVGLVVVIRYAVTGKRYSLLALAIGPILLSVVGSLTVTPMMLYRGYLPSVPWLCLLIGCALADQQDPFIRLAWVGPLAIVIGTGLLMTLAALQNGQIKESYADINITFERGLVVHMEDTSLVVYSAYPQPGVNHVLLDAGCGEQVAALGPVVRQAMGLQTISLAELPARYTLVGVVGPLSTACHERVFEMLRARSVKVIQDDRQKYFERGVYVLTKAH